MFSPGTSLGFAVHFIRSKHLTIKRLYKIVNFAHTFFRLAGLIIAAAKMAVSAFFVDDEKIDNMALELEISSSR